MRRSIHTRLDGDQPGSVTADEELEAAEMEEMIALATRLARESPAPDLRAGVMEEIAARSARDSARPDRTGILSRILDWLWSPIRVPMRPAYALSGALAALVLMYAIPNRPGDDAPAAVETAASSSLYVQFRLDAAGASSVSLAGSFTGWEPTYELREVAPDTWVAVVPLEPGVHDYLFVVDGREWVSDPVASPVSDGFGGTNSRLFLVPPANRT
jgi:hypothetical protein